MSPLSRSVAALATVLVLSGCVSLPRERGYTETRDLIAQQRPLPTDWSPLATDQSPLIPTTPLSIDDAVRIAFFNNPRLREEFTRLGFGRAELEDARRIANPSLGYLRLSPRAGNGTQITGSLSLGLTDLLLLSARKRLAEGELERIQLAVAGAALELATEVEAVWYEAVGAEQIAAMRDLVARASEQSAELAQRFFDAGNINRLQLEQERAAASQARIDATRAGADALRSRHALAALMGLPTSASWTIQTQLPAPRDVGFSADALVQLALESRLDLAAAKRAVALREDALGVTRRWRWVGDVEVGYERERELDGEVLRGPSLALALPLFNQGQGALARAQAELQQARAELDGRLLAVQNDTRLGLDALQVARTIAERYRVDIVPRREAIVARTQEQVNFMLVGVFELLLAKQQEYDAYQAYLEAVRDYWIARAALRGAVGGRLPDDGEATEPTLGVEAIMPAPAAAEMDHSQHGEKSNDPHAGHHMPKSADAADPHAGHAMPQDRSEPDPHAQHRQQAEPTKAEKAPEPDEETEHTHDHGEQP
ncbi:TolC family protein [Pseudomarimonas arenosa]|uniref:TolC family protein n=1 Tax=Pseudomarimonas arenosa TaxID=2774145 RepID=A0AAW3ZIU8_9GAMM|nr:TolC family protein [Pseudomarimonas arenosa]MBD8524396.1 TolC family protein [Pseudomarimonas arenosa]